ncbi:alpha/beta fold hydrolase [Streptomyces europaeiscabiei]|uniref:alpha/beta fold hydrolase n=1 Tax=Streptomyces europaeiscabiei TaxID=146819 RepID=UPI0006285327|nr:alpha/beta hydrolase [Streptomyces europaeiscabiei]MDX2523302.1 alpha/beta hydrolase [Streptomyces europaeiscabiei]MDX3707950.1 alpha/beta hydrolase [Streptomyces europaeiscabiei]MDX3776082.1 alpha/beta hydrolase [Streptomyces europaeiscabiei]MDX3832528.1 alpha/beta hydrolase [Streptomyces europaeiscabiei]MDX3841957.1 alpha/beta hydrolase [Streptomyces europaeiscabiei]
MSPTPTVLLVHGAFADASSWSGVIEELRSQDIPVRALPNPLRGLASDAAYVASAAAQIDGPVVLVGHSYGGAVITVAGAAENVVGLVYVAAYVPEQGESLGELQGRFPLAPLVANLDEWTYPVEGADPAVEVTIKPDAFPGIFAADVPAEVTRILAVSQRPLAAAVFTEETATAAWRTKRSWAVVADADEAINPDVQRFGAKRAGATVIEIEGASHAVAVSRAKEVASVIVDAVRATS